MKVLALLALSCFALAQQPFQSLEGAVGYIVVDRGGRVENFVVVETKEGSVRVVRVDREPSKFLKKTEDKEGGRR
ncbi:MAG: hypothetical protein N3C13_03895 [Aquificaceae bacterium]|nr:hypothetical protein [Aquificaceae bacterium]MCX8060324.1 hypothetical protein [Aquificaceae bacterium]MDW8097488.1 hypothetical protein [Aquificaceae bacterium]